MKVRQLQEELKLTVIAGEDGLEKEINGCYICDLLSLVMSNASSGNVWVTVQANINVVAVASLTDVACVIIAESSPVEQITISKANSEGIPILKTNKTAYALACAISKLI